jgi:hypothetical protein
MSIDRIGGPPRPPGAVGPSQDAQPAAAADGFRVDTANPTAPTEDASLLGRLERGEISVDDYVTGRVEEAVAPLAAKLDPQSLEFVKETLREQLASDPVLVELVRRATEGIAAR